MNSQLTFQRIFAYSGIVCGLLFFVGLVAGHFIPPLAPSLSAADVAEHYLQHANGIRLGAGLFLYAAMLYGLHRSDIGSVEAHTRCAPGGAERASRRRGVGLGNAHVGGNAVRRHCLSTGPGGRLNHVAQRHDVDHIRDSITGFAILSDARTTPLFPRWLGYTNIWAAIAFVPAVILPFFKSGPFAWNGIVPFWIPAVMFGIVLAVDAIWLVKAINDEKDSDDRALAASDAV